MKQDPYRKKTAPKYCKTHKMGFFEECPLCPQDPQKQVEEWEYKKGLKHHHGFKPGEK